MLTTEDLGDMPEIDASSLDEVLGADGFGTFAILSSSEETYIQAGNDWQTGEECKAFLKVHDSDPWLLEFREGGRQYRAVGNVTLAQVRQAFQSYLAGGSEWRSEFTWAELELKDGPPDIIAINNDNYHAEYVGRTADGRQFILTTPFVPAIGNSNGSEFVALYLFDAMGKLLEAKIEDFGPRATLDHEKRREFRDRWLQELGEVTYEPHREVAPLFTIKRFGTTFGLVIREPEADEDPWAVEMQPGNYMAFFEPWNSGDYDT